MTDDTNTETNSGNGNAPLSKEDSVRAQVQCLIRLAAKARVAALETFVALEKLGEYLDSDPANPTDAQKEAFQALLKAEGDDMGRREGLIELWRKLHPGHAYGLEDEIPF
jgi:hypothetical protein